ncbi:MAG TPA: ABC transporter ATP-binding protein [Candidatus Limnocylindria bacterium]|nr:ABC transporter ATP-binding protein [Candidatus Limnocylindria bacterium]
MMQIESLKAVYGHIEALHGVSLHVDDGEIVALIGSNGAGKTTLLNAMCGHVQKTAGSVRLDGRDITGMKPHAIARMGLTLVPEGRHVFPGLSVEENLSVGTVAWAGMRIMEGNLQADFDAVYALFPKLKERRRQLAWSLSGGEQQMLAIGRALMGHPKLLLLDEPSMGLAPIIISELFGKILDINRAGTTVLLVEQNATLALQVSSRAYIIERGRILLEGKSADLATDERVKEAYLGRRHSLAARARNGGNASETPAS